MMKRTVLQEVLTIVNAYVANSRISKWLGQILTEHKGKTDTSTVTGRNSKLPSQ